MPQNKGANATLSRGNANSLCKNAQWNNPSPYHSPPSISNTGCSMLIALTVQSLFDPVTFQHYKGGCLIDYSHIHLQYHQFNLIVFVCRNTVPIDIQSQLGYVYTTITTIHIICYYEQGDESGIIRTLPTFKISLKSSS